MEYAYLLRVHDHLHFTAENVVMYGVLTLAWSTQRLCVVGKDARKTLGKKMEKESKKTHSKALGKVP